MKFEWEIEPGGLGEFERAAVFALAEESGWKATRIARRLKKHPGTVYRFMCKQGLVQPRPGRPRGYLRNGRPVLPYLPEEDDALIALRVEGVSLPRIAAELTRRFGHPRAYSSIAGRLLTLAVREA